MKLAIMQPYFFPYVGYFQLIAAVDLFIVYDNVKYTKKGWITRNRMLQNGKESIFSLALKGDSDHRMICERQLSPTFDREGLLNRFIGAYRRAPCFARTIELIKQILQFDDPNLFRFLHHSIVKTCEHLGIATEIKVSSHVAIDHELKNQDKVLAMCGEVGAEAYVNAIGGMDLYSKESFRKQGINLMFIRSKPFNYAQFGNEFVPWLSIIDVMMFNPLDTIQTCISTNYECL